MTKDWVHGFYHSPACQILLQIVVRAVITSSPPAWTSSAGMLSTQANCPFFNDCTAASTSLLRMGWSSRVHLGTVQYWRISTDLVIIQLSTKFCPSVQNLSFLCEATFHQSPTSNWHKISSIVCFSVFMLYVAWNEDFLENLPVLFCFVQLKSVLLIPCVFWILFQWVLWCCTELFYTFSPDLLNRSVSQLNWKTRSDHFSRQLFILGHGSGKMWIVLKKKKKERKKNKQRLHQLLKNPAHSDFLQTDGHGSLPFMWLINRGISAIPLPRTSRRWRLSDHRHMDPDDSIQHRRMWKWTRIEIQTTMVNTSEKW